MDISEECSIPSIWFSKSLVPHPHHVKDRWRFYSTFCAHPHVSWRNLTSDYIPNSLLIYFLLNILSHFPQAFTIQISWEKNQHFKISFKEIVKAVSWATSAYSNSAGISMEVYVCVLKVAVAEINWWLFSEFSLFIFYLLLSLLNYFLLVLSFFSSQVENWRNFPGRKQFSFANLHFANLAILPLCILFITW